MFFRAQFFSASLRGRGSCRAERIWLGRSRALLGHGPPGLAQIMIEALFSAVLLICQSLLRVALHEDDWGWALDRIVRFLLHPNPEVRAVAVSSIGYLVRIHRAIDVTGALPTLYALQADAYVASRVRDTLEDIRQFVRAA